jgi:hypothetical protein
MVMPISSSLAETERQAAGRASAKKATAGKPEAPPADA